MSIVDRAANWAHAKPRRNHRVPPHGVPQQSVDKILSDSMGIFSDKMFNTDVGEQMLQKGSFLEV